MPVGPSHRSRSSSSRSYGGSSRSSSSSSRSYSSSSRSYSSSRYRSSSSYDYDGGGYSSYHRIPKPPKTNRQKAILAAVWGLVFSLIIAFIGGLLFGLNVGSASLIRRDAGEYAQIIKRAQQGKEGYYLIEINLQPSGSGQHGYEKEYSFQGDHEAYFKAYNEVRKNGVDFFYFVYNFTDDEGRRINGETYTCYSENAVNGIESITIAYTKDYDRDGSWDSMDVNYKLSKNMDYIVRAEPAAVGGVLMFVFAGLSAYLIVLLVQLHKGKFTFSDEKVAKKKVEITHKKCQYCGNRMTVNQSSCQACGARTFENIFPTEDDEETKKTKKK